MGGKSTIIKEGKTYYQFTVVRRMLDIKTDTLSKLISKGTFTQVQFRENGPLYIPRTEVIAYVQSMKR